jgi:hypothetical protein
MLSNAKVLVADMRHLTCAESTDVTFTEAGHVASAKTADVATPTTPMSSATAAAGLCTGGNQAAGKQYACQNHHCSFSHDILRQVGRTLRHGAGADAGGEYFSETNVCLATARRWGCLFAASAIFSFSDPNCTSGSLD